MIGGSVGTRGGQGGIGQWGAAQPTASDRRAGHLFDLAKLCSRPGAFPTCRQLLFHPCVKQPLQMFLFHLKVSHLKSPGGACRGGSNIIRKHAREGHGKEREREKETEIDFFMLLLFKSLNVNVPPFHS